jgi:cytochrome c oxidase subunit 2
VVQTQDEFDAWVAAQRVGSPLVNAGQVAVDTTAPPDSVEIKGRELFAGSGGCIGCHSMVGTPMAGIAQMRGPNLTHFGSRKTMVGAWLENTPENLTKWLSNPDSVKQGTLMVLPRKLTADEIATLVAYLRSHQ